MGKLPALSWRQAFPAVKYTTYSLLMLNIYLFLQEETGSLQHTFTGGMGGAEFVQVFAATIDTAAWVVLLLLFELETYVLDDRRIRGGIKLALHGVRGVCFIAIVYAFTGYCAELLTLYHVQWLTDAFNACGRIEAGWSVLVDLDKYAPLSAQNCAAFAAGGLRLDGFSIVAAPDVLRDVRWLAWVDVINAAAWILVVVVLEVEVRLQLRGRLTDTLFGGMRYLKYALYSLLFLAAIYWGVKGDFLDVWDASLWLFAFIFIELNVFDWQRETTGEAPAQARPQTTDGGA
jgi:hypothetical protein